MFKKALLLVVVFATVSAMASEKYSDGRPVYDDKGNLIIWTTPMVEQWNSMRYTWSPIDDQFSQTPTNAYSGKSNYNWFTKPQQNDGCILN